jgi:hypothetical protein
MKRFLTIMLAGLLIAAITAPALAWEFSMTGEAEYRVQYFARQGQNDLFGGPGGPNAAGVLTGVIGFAGPVAQGNGGGVLLQGFSAKGADAETGDARVWFYPEIRVNPAVRLRGEYWVTGGAVRNIWDGTGINTVGQWQNMAIINPGRNGWYTMWDGGGSTDPAGMSTGMWEKFWMTAQTPWGILAIGRRPFPFGLGWSTLHEKDADSDSWLISVPYGPLTFIYGQNIREVGDAFVENSAGILGVANAAPTFPLQVNGTRAAFGTDKNRQRNHNGAFAIVYRNGPTEFGSIARYVQWDAPQHALAIPGGPASRDDSNGNALSAVFTSGTFLDQGAVPISADIGFVLWVTYLKYFNGRFFANAEYDFEYGDWFRRGGRPLSMWGEAWEIELGAVCGPAKLTLSNFYSSGPDRQGGFFSPATLQFNPGALGVTPAGVATFDKFSQFLVFGGREKSIMANEFLLGIYGGGNNSYDTRGTWTATDLLAWSARLDYAVASNLNLFGTYMYANRASNTGTGIAQFTGLVAGFDAVPAGRAAAVAVATRRANVPDNYLGWEADIGVNWKLLEGMTFNGLFAYWAPGDWFKWAYVDYGSTVLTTVGGDTFPVNPGRGIDPIIGFQGSVVVDF